MPRNYTFAIGEYYHLYNRGNDRRIIFKDNHDHNRFLALLYLCNGNKSVDMNHYFERGLKFPESFHEQVGDPLIAIGAYALMPNHFHLLVKQIVDGGISGFMKKLGTAYSMYFNKRHSRRGSLYEGSYKSVHADYDTHLKYLFSYIHLNPVKIIDPLWKENGITDRRVAEQFLNNYCYSSYLDYIGRNRNESVILTRREFPDYFETITDFKSNLHEWLKGDPTKV